MSATRLLQQRRGALSLSARRIVSRKCGRRFEMRRATLQVCPFTTHAMLSPRHDPTLAMMCPSAHSIDKLNASRIAAGVWFIRELIEEYRPKQFETEKIRVLPMAAVSPMHWIKGSAHNLAARICTEYVDLDKCRSRFPNSTTVSFWTGTWMLTGPHGNPSTKLSVDRSKQVLLGLRREGDRSTKTLRELEAAANYTGPSGEIRVF